VGLRANLFQEFRTSGIAPGAPGIILKDSIHMSDVKATTAIAAIASNAPLPDSFDAAANDVTASPITGKSGKFDANLDQYVTGREKIQFGVGKQYVVIGRAEGWVFLKKDCPPEYLIRVPGQPKPAQPIVDKEAWPIGFNGQPEHPWKWTYFLYLLDTATGEVTTFSTNTVGGSIGVRELQEQITFMRKMRPGAVPIVALSSVLMQTQYGSKKPRPAFTIVSWKDTGGGGELKALEKPSTEEVLNDDLPF
jgi:hypothetical protein